MNISFSKIIDNRNKILEERIIHLEKVKNTLKLEDPIHFSISDIITKDIYNPRKMGLKVGVPQLNFLEELKGSYIYIFELEREADKNEILDKLKLFRAIENKDEEGNDLRRATTKIPTTFDDNLSNVLYVGSIKENIHKRIKEHIGFGSKATYAMHLKHWAPKELKLNFYYIKIENPDLSYDIEAALAEYLNLLIGKREK